MENRYLFRGKTISGNWVHGLLANKDDKWYISNKAGAPFAYEIRPESICQCTGLRDKNDALSWENDIVVYYDMTEERYLISWESNKACYEYQQYGCSMMNFNELSGCEIEVLGNIFDNPGLLEVQS